jgi:ABC-type Fe3+-hydroxamate transport system substrate-binding protein
MTQYTDALGRTVEIDRPPGRIVSLVPSLTEALFSFGAGERVAGITRFCEEPADRVAGVPKIGGTKNVEIAAVRALEPDLVLANIEENTRADVDALEAAGLTVFLTYPRTVAGAIDELRDIAEITGTSETAAPIITDAEQELRRAEAANEGRRSLPTFCPIWRNPWMTIGPDTYMHDLLRVCGAENVYGDASGRYPEVTLEEVAKRCPEVALLPDEPYRFAEKHVPEVIEKVGEIRIYVVNGKSLCWYGPRIAESLRYVQALLHGADGG